MAKDKIRLDSERLGRKSKELLDFMKKRIVGQDQALEKIAHAFEAVESGIRPKHRPILTLLFLGPSGVGKSLIPSALAEYWFNSRLGYTQINCPDYSNGYTLSTLQGAPPGYIGFLDKSTYSEKEIRMHPYPLLSQWNIDRHHFYYLYRDKIIKTKEEIRIKVEELELEEAAFNELEIIEKGRNGKAEKTEIGKRLLATMKRLKKEISDLREEINAYNPSHKYFSIVNFDEIEQGSEQLHKIMLSILEQGVLDLKDGRKTIFYNSIITATSNVGTDAIFDLMGKNRLGFYTSFSQLLVDDPALHEKIRSVAIKELEKFFGDPAFLNRFDDLIVFAPLSRESLEAIFDLELNYLKKILADSGFIVSVVITPEVKKFIIDKSTKKVEYGARELKRKIDNYLRRPLASLRTTFQLADGDSVYVSLENHKLVFDKDTN